MGRCEREPCFIGSTSAVKGLSSTDVSICRMVRPLTVIEGSQGATALVGIAELVVGVQELIDGEWWLYVESRADVAGCSTCGTWAVAHGRSRVAVRDIAIARTPTVLVLARRRWRRPERL